MHRRPSQAKERLFNFKQLIDSEKLQQVVSNNHPVIDKKVDGGTLPGKGKRTGVEVQ
jgi:hypothetical protein